MGVHTLNIHSCPPGSGMIEFPEFLQLMVRKMKAPDNQAELIDALRVFDQDNNGFLSVEHIKHVLTHCGEILSNKEMEAMVKVADPHGYGQVNYVGKTTIVNLVLTTTTTPSVLEKSLIGILLVNLLYIFFFLNLYLQRAKCELYFKGFNVFKEVG